MIKKIVKNAFAFCLGVFITLLFIEISLRSLGWYQNNKNLFTKIAVKNKNEVRILSLGDSMTAAGEKPFYPEELQNILSTSLPNKKIAVFNEGVPSFSSKEILFNLEKNLNRYRPDIVTIMIGTNDWGSVRYEEFAGIKSSDFLSNLKIYKLYKFLLKSVQDKLIKTAFAVPENVNLIELGNDSLKRGQINMAKDYFEKALQINPNNDQAYFGLGMVFYNYGERDKGVSYFKKAIIFNPNNYEAYIKLGEGGGEEVSYDKKIWYLQQAIKIKPKISQTYLSLANVYNYVRINKQRLETLNQDLQTDSNSYNLLLNKQLLETLNQGLQIDPHSYVLLMALATYYVEENRITDAIASINKAFISSGAKPKPLDIQLLAELYKSQGKTKEAGEVLSLVTKSSGTLAKNYLTIADILKKRGIILVAVQYPMRDIFPLKIILKDTDAVFVDNERSFKERLAKYGPEKYFLDRFGGDFGHMTAEGHRIVAENIADLLLKQIFKVKK